MILMFLLILLDRQIQLDDHQDCLQVLHLPDSCHWSCKVAICPAKISNVEQMVSSFAARVAALETLSASASSGSGLASSWNLLGHSDGSTATWSLGFMARGRRTKTETQDADLILFPAQRMNMHEVPFCFDFHVNNITRECLLGSKSSRQRPTHLSAGPPEYTAKQVPCQQEPNVRTVWPDTTMMVSHTQLKAHFAVPVPISLSASPSRLKKEKMEDDLRPIGEPCPQSYKKISLTRC